VGQTRLFKANEVKLAISGVDFSPRARRQRGLKSTPLIAPNA